jgi:hypothetical protein
MTFPRGVFRSERCGQSYGLTEGDTFHQGMRGPPRGGKAHDFGLSIDKRSPRQCEAWRAMVARAKAFAAASEANRIVSEAAKSLPRPVVKAFLKALTNGKG